MAKKTYDSSMVKSFPENFKLELPDGYRIDIDYDEDGDQIANLRGGFSFNDEGEETSEFSAAFITMNSTIENRENLIKEGKLKDHFVPGMMMEQVAEGVMNQLQEQFGPGTRLNLYSSYPASVIMKFYKPFMIFGVTLESYVVMYLVEVTENLFFGINTVYQNNDEGNSSFFKHLLNVIKSVRVSGKPVDIGKLTPKKLETALSMEPGDDVEALDLGLSMGINFQYGDEEINYTLNNDGSITGPDGNELPPYEDEDEDEPEQENPFFGLFSAMNEMNGPKISEEDSRKVIVDNKWSFRLPDGLDLLFDESHVDIIGSDTTAAYVVKGVKYGDRYFFDFELRERYEDGISTDVDVMGCRYDNDVISGNAQQKKIKDDDDLYVDLLNKPVFFFNSMVSIRVRGEDIRPWDFTAGLKNNDEEMSAKWDEVKVLINELAESIQLIDGAGKQAVKKPKKKENTSIDPDFIIQNGVLRKYIGDKRNIVIPDGVKELADSVFSGFTKIKTVTVPEGVKKIGRRCFENCTHMKNCYLPDSLEELGGYAFVDCHELKEVYLSDKIKSLGDSTFSECFALKDVRLPKKIKEIDSFTFKNCDAFSHIVIPDGVKSIGASAFVSCDNLEYLFIPASVTDITVDFMENHAFAGSEKLTVHTPEGSYAQKFAEEHNIPYQTASKGTVTADNKGVSSGVASKSTGAVSQTADNGFAYATPDESLYSHCDSKSTTAATNFLGMRIERRQSGTDYQFVQLSDALEDEDVDEKFRTAISKLSDTGAASYKLADRAAEMRKVFHVSPEIFNMRDDRECELSNGLMQKAYMMSALRSFAWTLSRYCADKGIKPANLSREHIKSIVSFIAEREWLNYDGDSYCKALCGTPDIHVYYIPDNTPDSVRKAFKQTGSLDGLRKDLEYILPAIEKLYKDVLENRDYNEPLEGNEADVLYAWCALAYAAGAPFFSEDGPMFYFYSQEETEEERLQREEKMHEEFRRRAIEERKETSKAFLKTYGSYIEKNPRIDFRDKKFVFTGLSARRYALEDDTDYAKLVEARGGMTRSGVSGVTDYLVVDPAGAGDSKVSKAIENQKNGKPIRIIHMDDFRKALGLPPDDTEGAAKPSAAKTAAHSYKADASAAKTAPTHAASAAGLTPEQQQQKEELNRQIENLRAQAAFYSAQDLSEEDRQTLAETKAEIEKLGNQMAGIESDQGKFSEYLRQKEEKERQKEEERQRKIAEAKAAGRTEDDEVDMFVILCNEEKIKGNWEKTQKEFYDAYKTYFPAYKTRDLGTLRKEVKAKIKDKDIRRHYTESFMKRSVKDRYDIVTDSYFSLDRYADYTLRSEDAIIRTAEWYTPQEMPEVRKLMDEQHDRDCKGADDAFGPVEEKWKKYWSAKDFLKIVVRDNADDLRDDCRLFQTKVANNLLTGPVIVEESLATKGMFQMSTAAMNFFPYYWNTTAKDIWETARKNEITDNTTVYIDDIDAIVRNAIKTIGEKYKESYPDYKPTLNDWNSTITRKASVFISYISGLYINTDRHFTAAEIKERLKSSFPAVQDLAEAKEKLFQLSKSEGLTLLAEILSERSAIRDIYDSIPKRLSEDIKESRKEKILAENESSYDEAGKLFASDSLKDLTKAETILGELGTFKDAQGMLKQVSSKLESVRSAQYDEAAALFEEGTEQSVVSAIDKLDELGLYRDAPTLSKQYREYLENERAYQSALKKIGSSELEELRDARTKLEGLSGFKNADELIVTCSNNLESTMSAMYADALSLTEQLTEESLLKARNIMNRLKPYSDSEKRIEELNDLILKEAIYKSAEALLSEDEIDPAQIKDAMNKYSSIEGYKDSSEKAADCAKQFDVACKYNYVKARKAEKVLSTVSQREAISLYKKIPGYDESDERIAICQKNSDSIIEILGLEKALSNAKECAAGMKKGPERKEFERFVNDITRTVDEKKKLLATAVGSESDDISKDGLLGYEQKKIDEIAEQMNKDLTERSITAKKKSRKKLIILASILAAAVMMLAIALPDLLKPDLMKHAELMSFSVHGIEYEMPEDWQCSQEQHSNGAYQYFTLSKNDKIVAALEVAYMGDTDLNGDARYDDETATHSVSESAANDIPNAAGYYDMVYADESAFEVTIYSKEGSVKNQTEFLNLICSSFKTAEYENPRRLIGVDVEYDGLTIAGTEVKEDRVNVIAEYDTGIGTGSTRITDWKLKEPVTLEAGKTSTITVVYDGKEYTVDVECTTPAPKDGDEEKDNENTGSTGRHASGGISGSGDNIFGSLDMDN